jgi:hypothetical protein
VPVVDMGLEVALREVRAATPVRAVPGTPVSAHENRPQAGLLYSQDLIQTSWALLLLLLAARQAKNVFTRNLESTIMTQIFQHRDIFSVNTKIKQSFLLHDLQNHSLIFFQKFT